MKEFTLKLNGILPGDAEQREMTGLTRTMPAVTGITN